MAEVAPSDSRPSSRYVSGIFYQLIAHSNHSASLTPRHPPSILPTSTIRFPFPWIPEEEVRVSRLERLVGCGRGESHRRLVMLRGSHWCGLNLAAKPATLNTVITKNKLLGVKSINHLFGHVTRLHLGPISNLLMQ